MILVDFSQVILSNFFANLKLYKQQGISEGLFRHMVLNSLRSYNKKFRATYGEMVICCDGRGYWRANEFPFYKGKRKEKRKTSDIDWTLIFEALSKIKREIDALMPYKVIEVEGAEADDIIATLVKEYHDKEPIMIVSGDTDFCQLQIYKNVEQYAPIQKKKVKVKDPKEFLRVQILKGCSKDGVPNFLSRDDVFMAEGARQTPLSEKKIERWKDMDPSDFCTPTMYRNYCRNKKLVDLIEEIPNSVQENIIDEFLAEQPKGRENLLDYFVKHRLKSLIECIEDF